MHRSSGAPRDLCVVYPPTGNRDALRKRAHYRSYAGQAVTISFTRRALPLVRTTVVSLARVRFLPTGSIRSSRCPTHLGRLPLSLVHFGPRRAEARGRGLGASRGALVGDCYVRKKPPRTKSVDNLNYISHHNPREPVKPTPAFCPGAPRGDSSE